MLRKLILIALCMGLIAVYGKDIIIILATGDMVALKSLILEYGYWAPLLSFLLIIIQAFLSPLPSVVIFIVNGIVFGGVYGFFISWVGSFSSAVLCFGLVRYLGFQFTPSTRVLAGVVKLMEEYQNHSVFVARVLPFIPFDLASYAFALTKVRLKTFLRGTALGQTPSIIFYSFWGNEKAGLFTNLAGIIIWTGLVSWGYYSWVKITERRKDYDI